MPTDKAFLNIIIDPAVKDDLQIIAGLLGYSLSAYSARAVAEQVARDKEAFPTAYAAAKEVQEEVRSQRSA